jgi:hypothetical protein
MVLADHTVGASRSQIAPNDRRDVLHQLKHRQKIVNHAWLHNIAGASSLIKELRLNLHEITQTNRTQTAWPPPDQKQDECHDQIGDKRQGVRVIACKIYVVPRIDNESL